MNEIQGRANKPDERRARLCFPPAKTQQQQQQHTKSHNVTQNALRDATPGRGRAWATWQAARRGAGTGPRARGARRHARHGHRSPAAAARAAAAAAATNAARGPHGRLLRPGSEAAGSAHHITHAAHAPGTPWRPRRAPSGRRAPARRPSTHPSRCICLVPQPCGPSPRSSS